MFMNKSNQPSNNSSQRVCRAGLIIRSRIMAKLVLTGLALFMWAMFAPAASAQTVTFNGLLQLRVTEPVGFAGVTIITNTFSYKTNGMVPDGDGNMIIQPINLSVSGLPSGVTCSITNTLGQTNFTATSLRTNSSSSVPLTLGLTFDGTTPEGTYPFTINASGGATDSLVYVLDVAHIWNGSTNAALDGAANWSDSTKWLGGGIPSGGNANVIFSDYGGQTNSIVSVAGVSTNTMVNSIVNNNLTIGSLRFSETNTSFRAHTIQIAAGKTLTITGTNGFSILRDYMNELASLSGNLLVTLVGTNGATLAVSNQNANFVVLYDNQQAHTLDMSGLDNFQATINSLALGDYRGYPNWHSINVNQGNQNNNSYPRKFTPTVNLARTNIIKTSYIGPDKYTNDVSRQYAVSFLATAYGSGSSTLSILSLGVSNLIYADSVLFVGANQGNGATSVRFNPSFAATNPVAIFRGTNGGRMSLFSVGDSCGTNGNNSNMKGYVDFGSSRGTVDALVDNVYLARDRKIIAGAGTPTYQGRLTIGAGTFDCNNLYVGYQEFPHPTNTWSPYRGYCQGMLTVSNGGVFKINNTVTLGYTTETNAGNIGDVWGAGYQNNGQINIGAGGTVLANKIEIGGVTKASIGNSISLAGVSTNIATLVISNTVGGVSSNMLGTLAMSGYSVLGLNIDGTRTAPYIYVTNLTTSGNNNIIKLETVNNVTYPAQIVLASYVSGTPSFSVTAPAFIIPSVITTTYNGSPAIAVNLAYGTPKNLVWRGGNGTWDSSTTNWLDQNTGILTNFVNGDNVAFDDKSGSTISLDSASSPLLPSAIAMTNNSLNFVFNGSGAIQGGVTLTKWGTGSVQIDVPTTMSVALNQGTLTNTVQGATLAAVVQATNTVLYFSGTISAGVVSAGAGTLTGSGIINGGIVLLAGSSSTNSGGATIIQPGGTFTNNGNLNGVPTLNAYSVLCNSNTMTFALGGTMNVYSNATFINVGNITGDNIIVGGTFRDAGVGSINLYNQLQIGYGGVFIPGGDGIGTTTVNGIGSATYSGRVTFLTGSTNIFKVDLDGGVNFTTLLSGDQDFGPSQGSQTYGGGTLLITNIGTTTFYSGLSFQMFKNSNDGGNIYTTGSATNCYPVMLPAAPLPGLAWNINDIVHNGTVSIVSVNTNIVGLAAPSNHIVIGNVYANGTNTDGTSKYATNNVIFVSLQWPTDYTGWRLQSQANDLKTGLSTNWSTVFGSPWTSSMTLSNQFNTNNCTFYRLIYP